MILLAALLLHEVPRGPLGETERRVGVALSQESNGVREYLDADQARSLQANSPDDTQWLQGALPTESDLAADLSELLPSQSAGLPTGIGIGLPSAGSSGSSSPAGRGEAGQISTAVFGAKALGSKFVYVFDRSGSMEGFGGRPLMAAKRELIRSLADLQDTSQFQIIFYNERPQVFRTGPGAPQLVWGNAAGKKQAEQFIRGIKASGGTRHLEALRTALGMSPDVVFFLTDADEPRLTNDELKRVRRWNRSATIHSIEFGFGPQRHADNFLARLARQNQGQHVYVDVSRLPGAGWGSGGKGAGTITPIPVGAVAVSPLEAPVAVCTADSKDR